MTLRWLAAEVRDEMVHRQRFILVAVDSACLVFVVAYSGAIRATHSLTRRVAECMCFFYATNSGFQGGLFVSKSRFCLVNNEKSSE